jgi:hypothetical protein
VPECSATTGSDASRVEPLRIVRPSGRVRSRPRRGRLDDVDLELDPVRLAVRELLLLALLLACGVQAVFGNVTRACGMLFGHVGGRPVAGTAPERHGRASGRGTDWRDQEGWGWIFKAWFRTRAESRQAWEAIKAEGWEIEPKSWARKVRVGGQ